MTREVEVTGRRVTDYSGLGRAKIETQQSTTQNDRPDLFYCTNQASVSDRRQVRSIRRLRG